MIKSGTVQNGAELGAPGDEYNKSPCREGSPRLLKDKTHRPITPSGIFSRIFNHLGAHAGLAFGKECSRTVSFVFEQSGSPFPARELIVLVTRRPELSAILNCATFDHDGYEPPFW